MKSILTAFAFLISGSVFADSICEDGKGRSVTFGSGAFYFEGLDGKGLTSGAKFWVTGSKYEHVPGGVSYSEYWAESNGTNATVRLSNDEKSAEVWATEKAKGNSVMKGRCREISASASPDAPTGPGWCMGRPKCESAGGMFAEDKKYCSPTAKSFLANSGKCFELKP